MFNKPRIMTIFFTLLIGVSLPHDLTFAEASCTPTQNSINICQENSLDCDKIYKVLNEKLRLRLESCLSIEECRKNITEGDLKISDLPSADFLSTVRNVDGKRRNYMVTPKEQASYSSNAAFDGVKSRRKKDIAASNKSNQGLNSLKTDSGVNVDHIGMSDTAQRFQKSLEQLKKEHQERMKEIENL